MVGFVNTVMNGFHETRGIINELSNHQFLKKDSVPRTVLDPDYYYYYCHAPIPSFFQYLLSRRFQVKYHNHQTRDNRPIAPIGLAGTARQDTEKRGDPIIGLNVI
jgi:hypothetical protein